MDSLIIDRNEPIKRAMEIIDKSYIKTLFVTNEAGTLLGSLTDGDIRRWILRTGNVKGSVVEACNKEPFVLKYPIDRVVALNVMKEKHILAAPVISEKDIIEEIITKEDLLEESLIETQELKNIPVVIMAGGKGTRLDPFTRILPKPLIPIGNQTVIELIMQEFEKYGASEFFVSLNLDNRSRLIKAYFDEGEYDNYSIAFVEENNPLGTAGSLKKLDGLLKGDLFVTNCDIIIKSNYNDMLKYHREKDNDLTIVAAIHDHSIPYGVCNVNEDGQLGSITEKPQYSMLINTGMYILKSDIVSLIPSDAEFHFTDFVELIKAADHKIGVFPIADTAYHDIGQWEAYRNALPLLTKDD